MEENKTLEVQEDDELVEIQEVGNDDRDFRMAIGVGIGILGTVLVRKGVSKIKNIINKRKESEDEFVDVDEDDYEELEPDEVVDEKSVKETK